MNCNNDENYTNQSEYIKNRFDSLNRWKEKYPEKFEKRYSLKKALELKEGQIDVFVAGRIMQKRQVGKICFIKLQDYSGFCQIVIHSEDFEKDSTSIAKENFNSQKISNQYEFYMENLDLGDIVGIEGEIFKTRTDEKSIKVYNLVLLTKCLRPLPEKWHGLKDEETKTRQRYLDLIINESSKEKFKFRYNFIQKLKEFFNDHDYVEVETPILQSQASGALATPFQTHHKALDIPLYLRIAPETYLKRLMAGGYERVYEIGKCFRNEGIDTTHLQEFTMLEFYTAYWNYEDAIQFVLDLFYYLIKEFNISETLVCNNVSIDMNFPWKKKTYADIFREYTSLDLESLLENEEEPYQKFSKLEGIDVSQYKSLASLIDAVYKKYCRPNLINPTIITNQPSVLGPLARRSNFNSLFSDRFQLIINGLEIVNAYSELVDPILQRNILNQQKNLKNNGEEEAMELEEDFLIAMEYGMPPMAGVGIGIDRLISLLTASSNLKDVIFFPIVK